MKSIRRRLITRLVLGLLILSWVCGAALYVYVRHVLSVQFDASLLEEAQTFAATTEQDPTMAAGFDFTARALPEFLPSPRASYYQVRLEDGRTLARSPSLEEGELPRLEPPSRLPLFDDVMLSGHRQGRAVALCYSPQPSDDEVPRSGLPQPGAGNLILVMARSRAPLDHTLAILISGVLLMGIALPMGATLLAVGVVHRGLRPLNRIASEAAAIGADRLSHRFPTEQMPEELHPICERLNELLERLEAAFRRERRFSADVAHELRTPIAELRTLAEVALVDEAGGQDSQDRTQYFRDVVDVAAQMEHLVTKLLTLSRCDAGLQSVDLRAVDIVGLVRDTWRPYAAMAEDRQLDVEFRAPGPAYVRTDSALLAGILGNLFANAVAYTPESGTIELTVFNRNGACELALRNSNRQLAAADLIHLSEPFWRKDASRSDPAHAGLGLSLVSAYARLLHVDVRTEMPSPDMFQVVLRIPASAT